jgi:hypothetical protein
MLNKTSPQRLIIHSNLVVTAPDFAIPHKVRNTFSLQEVAHVFDTVEMKKAADSFRVGRVVRMPNLHDLIEVLRVEVCPRKRNGANHRERNE